MRLVVLLAVPFTVASCATMSETRTERILSREFRGTRLERTPELDQVKVALRVDGAKLRVTVRRDEACLVSSTELKTVDAAIEQSPAGVGFLGELVCVGVGVPLAVLYLPKRSDDSDPFALGSAGRSVGAVAAGAAAACAAAAIYDWTRAKSRQERAVVEVPLAPTPAPCGERPAVAATVVLRADDGSARTETTDERGEASFDPPFLGMIEATFSGRTARTRSLPEARLIATSGTFVAATRILES